MPLILRPTLTETYLERIKTTPSRVGFQSFQQGSWKSFTFQEFDEIVRHFSFGLMNLGLKKGDVAAILSNTRLDWAAADMAILGAGAISVPVYASSTAEDCAYILNDCEAKILFVENQSQLTKILGISAQIKKLEKIIVFDPFDSKILSTHHALLSQEALIQLGKREESLDPLRFEKNLMGARPDDVFTIGYTSGTMGQPKGADITHDNMVSVLEDALKVLHSVVVPDQEVLLAFLPFSHILGRVESMAAYTFGYQECYSRGPDFFIEDLQNIRPTLIFAVPRVFEKAYLRVKSRLDDASPPEKKLFHWALQTGKDAYRQLISGEGPSLKIRAQLELAKRTILSPISKRFGGRLRFAVCGGAPLSGELAEFFYAVGIPILEGYGLTETCGPITLNPPLRPRFGTVGRVFPEVQIRIAEDGEILVKSRKVFAGYHKLSSDTQAVIRDGWFATGDIGTLHPDGYLQITDRKKALIATSGGKKIAPQKIENLAQSLKLIHQIFVYGDKRKFLSALVTLDRPTVEKLAAQEQILFSEYKELVRHPKVLNRVQRQIDELNSHLASFERIKKFRIVPRDFSIDEGEMTPSLKLKRKTIESKFASELDSMYLE
jgi:long-chain acyl-CoA synthetase